MPKKKKKTTKGVGKKGKVEELEKKELENLAPELQSNYIAKLISTYASESKKEPSEIIWLDFRDYINHAFGQNSAGIVPRLITRLGGFNRIRDSHFPKKVTSESIERVALMEGARTNRKFANLEVYDEYFLAKFVETANKLNDAGGIKIEKFRPSSKNTKTSRVVHLVLSDIHYQSLIKKAETGHSYGNKEEARRSAYIAEQVANYKLDHRDEQELVIWLLGDIIQNQLHDPRDGSPIASQIIAATKYLTEMIGYLASAYKKVTVKCATGNHGRNLARHKDRAVHQKWDSLETVIYSNLASLFSNITNNVTFDVPKTPWVSHDALGHSFYATHGDTAFNPGNPGKAVNTQMLQVQVNNINAARELENKSPYKVFFAGHVHRSMQTFLDNGAVVFTNGPLCPPDGFAVSIGIYSTQCGQWLIESTENHVVGDVRFLRVGQEQDNDPSLDKIIKPYDGGLIETPRIVKFNGNK